MPSGVPEAEPRRIVVTSLNMRSTFRPDGCDHCTGVHTGEDGDLRPRGTAMSRAARSAPAPASHSDGASAAPNTLPVPAVFHRQHVGGVVHGLDIDAILTWPHAAADREWERADHGRQRSDSARWWLPARRVRVLRPRTHHHSHGINHDFARFHRPQSSPPKASTSRTSAAARSSSRSEHRPFQQEPARL